MNIPPSGNDFKKTNREFASLRPMASIDPDMRIYINPGICWIGETLVEWPGGHSQPLVAPPSDARWVLLCIDSDGSIVRLDGLVAANPVFPDLPDAQVPIAAIYLIAGTTKIISTMVYDIRPIFGATVGGEGYTLPIASQVSLGGVKVGSGLNIDLDGTLNANPGGYTLPPATVATLGGVIVGSGLSVLPDGTVSVTSTGWDGSTPVSLTATGQINLKDKLITASPSDDIEIYHFDNGEEISFSIVTTNPSISLNLSYDDGGAYPNPMIRCEPGGRVYLTYGTDIKIETQSDGIEVNGVVDSDTGYRILSNPLAVTDLAGATHGSIFYVDGSGDVQELAPGTSGDMLQTNGAGSNPTWATPPGAAGGWDGTTDLTATTGNLFFNGDQELTFWEVGSPFSYWKFHYYDAGNPGPGGRGLHLENSVVNQGNFVIYDNYIVSGPLAVFQENGGCEFYYRGTRTIHTTQSGITLAATTGNTLQINFSTPGFINLGETWANIGLESNSGSPPYTVYFEGNVQGTTSHGWIFRGNTLGNHDYLKIGARATGGNVELCHDSVTVAYMSNGSHGQELKFGSGRAANFNNQLYIYESGGQPTLHFSSNGRINLFECGLEFYNTNAGYDLFGWKQSGPNRGLWIAPGAGYTQASPLAQFYDNGIVFNTGLSLNSELSLTNILHFGINDPTSDTIQILPRLTSYANFEIADWNDPNRKILTGGWNLPTSIYHKNSTSGQGIHTNDYGIAVGTTATKVLEHHVGNNLSIASGQKVNKLNQGDSDLDQTGFGTTDNYIVAFTALTTGRTYTIAHNDIISGTTSNPRVIIVKDESGNASVGTPITVQPQGGFGHLIDGVGSIQITTAYGSVRLYADGTNLFTF